MPQVHDPKDHPEEAADGLPRWDVSHAKELMRQDTLGGVIPRQQTKDGPTAREIFLMRPEFKHCGWRHFPSHLKSMRETLAETESAASRDLEAFKICAENYPPSDLNSQGYPHWEGSAAQQLLQKDIDEDVHTDHAPFDLWSSRPECQEFPPDVFRGHIHQELKTRKHLNHLKVKAKEADLMRKERLDRALKKNDAKEKKAKEKEEKAKAKAERERKAREKKQQTPQKKEERERKKKERAAAAEKTRQTSSKGKALQVVGEWQKQMKM